MAAFKTLLALLGLLCVATVASGCTFSNGRWNPPGCNDLGKCRTAGQDAAVFVAQAACDKVKLSCPAAGAPEAAAAFSPALDGYITGVFERACISAAETACRQAAFGAITDQGCKDILNNGPGQPGGSCNSATDANNIFNTEVNNLCKPKP